MINLDQLSMHIGSRILFTDVSLNLRKGQRYGLVGANGTGKSTLLKVLSGDDEPSFGAFTVSKESKLGFLKQDQFLFEESRIIDVCLQGKPKLWKALEAKEKLLEEGEWTDEKAWKLSDLEEVIDSCDGYVAEAFAEELLVGLGIEKERHHHSLGTLSGGFKLRVLLARSLFDKPDILLLDEPTNFLDLMTICWLERYLKQQYDGLLLFISHDRDFLNHLATHILDIDYGEIRSYTGNYDQFVKEKTAYAEQRLHQKKNVEKKIAKMQVFVDRFRYKPSKSRQAMSREKMIEKMEVPETEKSSRIRPTLQLDQGRPSGKRVLKVEGVSKSYGEKKVIEQVSFEVHQGEKIAIIGRNGMGKSTLIKGLVEALQYDSGTFEWGHAVNPGYFAQESKDLLLESGTLLDWLQSKHTDVREEKLRTILGMALFPKDDVNKNVLSLSGGEAARLLFAHLMLQKPNVLVVDEPTNHLDLEACEALTEAFKEYPGTMLVVSHDRFLVENVATRIILLTQDGFEDFTGSYDEFLEVHGHDYLSR